MWPFPTSARTFAPSPSGATSAPAALVRWFLMKRLGVKKSGDLDLKLRVLIETGERLIAYAYDQPSESERKRVIAEMKLMLANYLFGQ